MIRIIQKIIAKVINSKLIFNNPYIDFSLVEEKVQELKMRRYCELVTLGEESKFYSQAEVFNFQNDKLKIKIGLNSHIRGTLLVFGYDGKITIGNDCYIGERTQIWSANEICIGNSVLISHNCNIIDNNSHEENYIERHNSYVDMLKRGHSTIKPNIKTAPIIIEDNVWISFNVTILKGVKIGKGAIIGAGSLITKDVEPFTIMAGNPVKTIKKINE